MTYPMTDGATALRGCCSIMAAAYSIAYSSVASKPGTMKRMCARLKKEVNEEEDSVRFYQLCQACLKEVKIIGHGQIEPEPEVVIV